MSTRARTDLEQCAYLSEMEERAAPTKLDEQELASPAARSMKPTSLSPDWP